MLVLLALLGACSSGSQITREQKLSKTADAPYKDLLVIALLENFEARKRLDRAIVDELAKRRVKGVASTSKMKTTTPMSRETYLAMVQELNPEAVMVTQLIDIKSTVKMKESASPEATYNVRPTWYFNVWEVELTEYREPKSAEFKSAYALLTEVYQADRKERVWAIESKSKVTAQGDSVAQNYVVFLDEGKAQVKRLRKDRLIP